MSPDRGSLVVQVHYRVPHVAGHSLDLLQAPASERARLVEQRTDAPGGGRCQVQRLDRMHRVADRLRLGLEVVVPVVAQGVDDFLPPA
jgi:hypothetical protein